MQQVMAEVVVCLQGRLGEEQHQSLLLDARRRAYYKMTRKHLKESVLQADTGAAAMPEDSELQGATSESCRPLAALCCASCDFAVHSANHPGARQHTLADNSALT